MEWRSRKHMKQCLNHFLHNVIIYACVIGSFFQSFDLAIVRERWINQNSGQVMFRF